MTLRLIIACDPGITGALAFLADGDFAGVRDMPTLTKPNGKQKIDAANLAALIREEVARHPGAAVSFVVEDVAPMPSKVDGKGMGASSAFSFGRSVGAIEGVVAALRLSLIPVHSVKWKNALQLRGTEKDVTRTRMIERFPAAAQYLARKKDIGRADALAMAVWKHLDDGLFDGRIAA